MTIRKTDLVLEIGPGAYPYWRSDCLLDKFDNDSVTDVSQFGGLPQQTLGKPLFLLENTEIPFKDQSFDYIICGHVLEHVDHRELPGLTKDIMRVAKRAYIEFPRPIFDFLYDFDVHLNLMDIVGGEIICLPKEKTRLQGMKRFTRYALELRAKCGFAVEKLSLPVVAVGKEFEGNIPVRICQDEEEFFFRLAAGAENIRRRPPTWRITHRLRRTMHAFTAKKRRSVFEELLK